MEKKEFVPSVLFFKRMIAATLAFIILSLTTLNIVNGVRLHRAHVKIREFEATEERRRAEEEEERARNAIPPEKEKPAGEEDAASILAENWVIAHALGSVDGVAGLNCLEAFEQNYEAGVRVFEVDFRQTRDGFVVLRHDWRANWQDGISEAKVPTLAEFLSLPILDKYTPLSFTALLELMERYPDVCIVTDTKFVEPEAVTAQFTEMLKEAEKLGLSYLFDRMYVQVYSMVHFQNVNGIYHFPHYIYTLYQDNFNGTEESFRDKVSFCVRNGIEAITMNAFQWNEEWRPIAEEQNIKIYVHTVNDPEAAKDLLLRGVSGIYTDTLLPGDMEE